ncbi:hypothetical protein [Sporisorium scitamineum]|nr:hypothetical protein [Sporisorium scitamineum]
MHAVAHVLDVARTALKSGLEATVISIDVAGAFNCISHERLVSELEKANLHAFAAWISAWLTNRTFRLRLEGTYFPAFTMHGVGVPQGSPLSPLLWAFYTESLFAQDLPRGVSLSGVYVDDLFAVTTGKIVEEAIASAQAWTDLVLRWSDERGLGLDKPSFLITTRSLKRRPPPDLHITVGDTIVKPSTLTIRLLGVIINSRLTHTDFVTRKCNQTRYAVNILHRSIREIGEVDLPIRLRLAKTVLLPILDYASTLHPIVTGAATKDVFKAEKDIWLLVLNMHTFTATPTSITLAFELGQHSHVYRWRYACLLFFARSLATPGHSSTDHARTVLASIGSSTDLSFGVANLFQHIGESHLPGAMTGPSIHILAKDPARQAEYRARTLNKAHAVRIYTDGSRKATQPNNHRLGAAFVAYAHKPQMEWNAQVALHADHQNIDDPELYAILIALHSCLPGALQEGLYWKRIDVFSDSQHALLRLGSPWQQDRRPLQYLTAQIREYVESLWQTRRTEVVFWWIPSHSNIPGNVAADTAAKQALALPPPPQAPPTSLKIVQALATTGATSAEHGSWNIIASTGIRAILDGYHADSAKTYIGLTAPLTKLLLRFRSNVLLGTTRGTTIPCSCGSSSVTRHHIFLECVLPTHQRATVLRLLPPSDRTDLAKILQGGHFVDALKRRLYLAALEAFLERAWQLLLRQSTHLARSRPTRAGLIHDDAVSEPEDSSFAEEFDYVIDITGEEPRAALEPVRQRAQPAPPRPESPNYSSDNRLNWQIDLTRDGGESDRETSPSAHQVGRSAGEREADGGCASDDPLRWQIDLTKDSSESENAVSPGAARATDTATETAADDVALKPLSDVEDADATSEAEVAAEIELICHRLRSIDVGDYYWDDNYDFVPFL